MNSNRRRARRPDPGGCILVAILSLGAILARMFSRRLGDWLGLGLVAALVAVFVFYSVYWANYRKRIREAECDEDGSSI